MIDLKITAEARPWKGLVLHHSAGADKQTRDWEGIVKYHTSYRVDFNIVTPAEFAKRLADHNGKHFETPWSDVGYHGGIEIFQGVAVYVPGRPLSEIGAHAGVKGASNRFNTEYIGLCIVGNFDAAPPPKEIWDLAVVVARSFMVAFNFPAAHVIGHREVYDKLGVPRQKSCPGTHWDLNLFRADLDVKIA